MKHVDDYSGQPPSPPAPDALQHYAAAVHRATVATADALHHGNGIAPLPDMRDLTTIYTALHRMRREATAPETAKC